MSSFNFPTNPSIGDTHVVGANTYTWNGYAWVIKKVPAAFTATDVSILSTTQAVSTTTGALVVSGGAGIGGNLWVGGTLYINDEPVLTTSSFAYAINEGPDIDISLNPINGALVFSDISTLQSVTNRGSTTTNKITITNSTISTSTTTGALVIAGGIGIGDKAYVQGRVNCESVQIEDAVFDSTPVNIATNATTVIDTYSLTQYRAAKYFIQISEGSGPSAEFHAQEITLIASNTGTVDISVYGLVTTNGPSGLGQFDAIVDGSDVKLRFTADFATAKVIKVLRTAMTV